MGERASKAKQLKGSPVQGELSRLAVTEGLTTTVNRLLKNNRKDTNNPTVLLRKPPPLYLGEAKDSFALARLIACFFKKQIVVLKINAQFAEANKAPLCKGSCHRKVTEGLTKAKYHHRGIKFQILAAQTATFGSGASRRKVTEGLTTTDTCLWGKQSKEYQQPYRLAPQATSPCTGEAKDSGTLKQRRTNS